MEFSSLVFLFYFLPLFIPLLFLFKPRERNLFLVAVSLFFYFWGEGSYVLLLVASVGLNYLLGIWMRRRSANASPTRPVFILGVVLNLAMLTVFKYTGFLVENINAILAAFGLPLLKTGTVHLPIGISFITFQTLSYIIDVHQQRRPAEGNLIDFSLYVSFFPKLITGPIAPYHQFGPQLSERRITMDGFALGIRRFIVGLAKKVLLADKLAPVVSQVFAVPAEAQSAGLAWLGIIAFTLQIYFDFAGYTDMAIGLGKMCGFDLPENFNYPYVARSVRDFWTRWHISLAQWLRDYLFLPIAYAVLRRIPAKRRWGVKAEDWAYFLAAPATMTLCGLWHGASWNFVFWGAFFGFFLAVEHAGLEKRLKRLWTPLRVLYTQVVVVVAWVFFRAPDFPYAFSYLKAMTGLGGGRGSLYYPELFVTPEILIYMVIGVLASTPFFKSARALGGRLLPGMDRHAGLEAVARTSGLVFLFVWTIMALSNGTYNPFIYFRF